MCGHYQDGGRGHLDPYLIAAIVRAPPKGPSTFRRRRISTQHSYGTYPSSQEYPRAHRQFSSTSLPAIEHQIGSSRYDLPTFHDMPSEVYTHGSGSALGRGTDHARVHHIAYQQTLLDRRTNNEYQQGDQQSIAGSHSQVAMQTMNAPSAQLVGRSAHIRSPPSRGTSAATSVSSRASHSSARAQYASPYPPPSVQFSAPSYAEHRFASTQLGRSVSTSHSVFHAAASSSGSMDEHEAAHNLSKAAEHDDFLEEYF